MRIKILRFFFEISIFYSWSFRILSNLERGSSTNNSTDVLKKLEDENAKLREKLLALEKVNADNAGKDERSQDYFIFVGGGIFYL